jgi:hypothetical protein
LLIVQQKCANNVTQDAQHAHLLINMLAQHVSLLVSFYSITHARVHAQMDTTMMLAYQHVSHVILSVLLVEDQQVRIVQVVVIS